MSPDKDPLAPYRAELRSADPIEPRVRELARLFPEAVRDGKIDVTALRAALGDLDEDGPERFGLTWPGKADAIRIAQARSGATLVPQAEESVDWATTQNVVIEGENLEVLKVLQRSYHRKIKLIYIDPPYNTGKDFVYTDDFRDPLGEYLRLSGQTDADGGRLRANTETSGRFHSAWLSMMWPRLHLARSLLRDDGVIVVSLDDNEAPRARLLLDEIFGEENFVAQMVWEGGRKNDATFVSVGHDYMLVYARDHAALKEADERWRVPKPGVAALSQRALEIASAHSDPAEATARWREELKPLARKVRAFAEAASLVADERPDVARVFPELRHPVTELPGARYNRVDHRGAYRASDLSWPGGGGPTYEILHPRTGLPVRVPTRGWLFQEEEMRRLIADDRIDFKADETGVPEFKRYLTDAETEVLTSVFYRTRTRAQQDLNELLGEDVFDFPKDVEILARLLEAATGPDDLVMDFFAGSGTFAEATWAANERDGGSRRYVISQMPEPIDAEAYESIADLCRERIRRAGKRRGVPAGPQRGFRAYRLDRQAIQRPAPRIDADDLTLDVGDDVGDGRPDEALLTEVLLGRGFDLLAPVAWSDVAGLRVASVADGALLACFTRTLTVTQFEALVAEEPAQIVLLEAAFGASDETKVNALQHLRTVNAHGDTPIELLLL